MVGVKTWLVWIQERKKDDKMKTPVIGNSWRLWLEELGVIEIL